MRDDVGRQTAEGPNFEDGCVTRKIANGIVEAIQVTSVKQTGMGDLDPVREFIGEIDEPSSQ
jgi:hypothetical protein